MECKNCGMNLSGEYRDVLNRIKNVERKILELKEELSRLNDLKLLYEDGFCSGYCNFRYHEG